MNRKAIGWSTAAALILGLAFLLVILIFLFKIGIKSNSIVEDSECKSSIMSHYVIKKMTREVLVSEIYCPTKYYTIPGKNDEDTKKQLADALKSCWGTWGRGELNLFEDEARYCHICSAVDFKKKDGTITGFNDYLFSTQVSADSDLTYLEYLMGFVSEKADPEAMKKLEPMRFAGSIDTSKSYAVMFVYVKGKGEVKEFLDSMDALGLNTIGGGVTTGLIAGGLAAGGTILLASPPGWLVAGILAVGVGVGAAVGANTANDVDWISTTMFTEYNAQNMATLKCEISPARQDKVQKALG